MKNSEKNALMQDYPVLRTCLVVIFYSLLLFFFSNHQVLASKVSPDGKLLDENLQQKPVTGIIKDATTGESLPGVNVVIKGTTIGVQSDIDGRYSIGLNGPSATLVFSFIGYNNLEVAVNEGGEYNVSLVVMSTSLDEVVVVGYGTQKKVSLTSAVAPISGEDLANRTVNNIQQALQGNIPGLTIADYGSGPGRTNMMMRIRGVTTLSNNDPLVIVDGLEQDFSDINPLDIETITILKDASSTAIYGSRASNGVILVTTKRAKSEKLTVTLNSYYAIQRGNNKWEHMELEDYMRMQQVAYMNSYGNPGIYTDEYIEFYIKQTDREMYPLPNTWYDEVIKPAPMIRNSLSISGGTDKIKSMLNVSYLDQTGIVPNNWSNTAEIRLNNDFKPSDKISFSADLNYRNKYIHEPYVIRNATLRILQTSLWAPKYSDGRYGLSADGHNPVLWAKEDGNRDNYSKYLTGNIKGVWEIINGLKFTLQYGVRTNFEKEKAYQNKYNFVDELTGGKRINTINKDTETRNDYYESTLNALLNYSKTIGKHSFNVLGGYSRIRNNNSSLSAYRQVFYSNDLTSLDMGADDATKTNSGKDSEWALLSFFGRVNYSLMDKYLFEANIRHDGSSRFTGNNTYSTFPSFSAGWRVSEESFFSDFKKVVNELKIRGSYGYSGNQAVGLYSYLATFSPLVYSFGDVSATGFRQEALANTEIGWETTAQTNIGADVELFKSKISLTVEYYIKKTFDILLNLPVPATLGLDPSPQNAGRVDNRGWDFTLTLRNSFGDLNTNVNFNLNINNNEVIDLAGTGPYMSSRANESRYTTQEGLPIYSFWGYQTDGFFQTLEEIANYPTIVPDAQPGDVKFVDRNKDGVINPDDRMYLGRTFPKFTFGSNLHIDYKAFALNIMFQGVAGVKTRVGGALAEMGIYGGFTHKIYTDNYWTPENRDADYPRPLKFDLRNINMADRDLLNGSYLRMKNIQLQYTIPSSITNKIRIENMSVYISATNLLTIAELNKFNTDPESEFGGRADTYPQTSTTTLGINVNF